jgi:putative transcriptional regulator
MSKLSDQELAAWEKNRDLNAEILEAVSQMKCDSWMRKTDFFPQPDGTMRRLVTRNDGTVEKDEIIPKMISGNKYPRLRRSFVHPPSIKMGA